MQAGLNSSTQTQIIWLQGQNILVSLLAPIVAVNLKECLKKRPQLLRPKKTDNLTLQEPNWVIGTKRSSQIYTANIMVLDQIGHLRSDEDH